jgi:hypothetical protein
MSPPRQWRSQRLRPRAASILRHAVRSAPAWKIVVLEACRRACRSAQPQLIESAVASLRHASSPLPAVLSAAADQPQLGLPDTRPKLTPCPGGPAGTCPALSAETAPRRPGRVGHAGPVLSRSSMVASPRRSTDGLTSSAIIANPRRRRPHHGLARSCARPATPGGQSPRLPPRLPRSPRLGHRIRRSRLAN